MPGILLIDNDRHLAQRVGLACLGRDIAVKVAENFCEGIRLLADGPVSAVLVDAGLLRLPGAEPARALEAVAPGVPVVVLVSEKVPVAARVRYQVLGFQLLSKPFAEEDLLEKVETLSIPQSGRSLLR